MKIIIRRMGNSQGVLIPKPVLRQVGLENEAELKVEKDCIILRKPQGAARSGWAEASRKIAAGAKLIGHKVGLTSKAMQRSSQIDEPDYGHLLDHMMVQERDTQLQAVMHAEDVRISQEHVPQVAFQLEERYLIGQIQSAGAGIQFLNHALRYPAVRVTACRQRMESAAISVQEQFAPE